MKKFILVFKAFLIIILVPNSVFSQQKTPKDFKKIHFTYTRKTKIFINENGVFADTLLFAIEFPDLEYTKTIHPLDPTLVCGVIKIKDFWLGENKLVGLLYHSNEIIQGVYDVNKNKTAFNVLRDDNEIRSIFKKYLNVRYEPFEYKVTIDYNKKTVDYNFPNTRYLKKFSEEEKIIRFKNDGISGKYIVKSINVIYDNLVVLNENLNNKIIPIQLFTNNNFGVQETDKIYENIQLTSVTYE